MVMNRWVIGVASLAVASMAAAGQAAAQGSARGERPLDLTLPRQAGQWTDLAVRHVAPEPAPAASQPARAADAGARSPNRPYGTGYEARMSPALAAGNAGRAAGSPPAPAPASRGRGR